MRLIKAGDPYGQGNTARMVEHPWVNYIERKILAR